MKSNQNRSEQPIDLFTPFDLGGLRLANRLVMAPLTRNRAGPSGIPQEMNVEYYRQRASAGLIITEGAQISERGIGYPSTPGIHTRGQVDGWKRVTETVHEQGGRIFLQLWHVGRISHPSLQPDGCAPLAPSSVLPEGEASTYEGPMPFVPPRSMSPREIAQVVEEYRQGAANARAASFDGVEIHGANGYSDEYPVGRFYRNCKGAVIYEGTREIHKLMQADYVLGYRTDKPTRCELPAVAEPPA